MAPGAPPIGPVRSPDLPAAAARWLRDQARPAQRWIVGSVVAGGVEGLVVVAQAWLTAAIVHGAWFGGRTAGDLVGLFAGLAAAVIARAVARFLRDQAGFRAGALVRQTLRETLVRRLLLHDGPHHGAADQPAGGLTTAAVDQVEALQDYVARYLPGKALAVVVPLTIVLAVAPWSWAAALILLVTAPLVPFFVWLVGMGAARASQQQFAALARLGTQFVDRLRGLTTLRLLDRVDAEAREVGDAADELRRRTMKVLRIAFLTTAVLELFTALGVGLVAVYLGLTLLESGTIGLWGRAPTFEVALFLLILSAEFYLPLRRLGTLFHARSEAAGAAESLRRLLDGIPEPPPGGSPRSEVPPPDPIPALVLDRVGVDLAGHGQAVLDDVSLTIAQGEHLAVVGPSGAGKTTLVQVLLGAQAADRGEVRAGHRPLAEWDPARWREHLAWVGQQPRLFHGSLRENIALGRPDAATDDLEAAARAARVLDFARDLPRGLDTAVGEIGVGLSGGQIQRVAVARAILKDAPLLLLDEPTANLDADSERLVLAGLAALGAGRTVIAVTHRLDTCQEADRVAVLDQGRLVQLGAHDDLLGIDGVYRRLVIGEAPPVGEKPPVGETPPVGEALATASREEPDHA